ncbi:hypothetical protein BMS3Abin14_00461 [bacterium BMS3Abin14]|nr:hypothetical protein BMS3Abin14_00461 [bacterium BMS3Abin14]
MLEFITTMAVIALVFCAATVFIALIASSLLKIRNHFIKRVPAESKGE